jgi:hypothetical protein
MINHIPFSYFPLDQDQKESAPPEKERLISPFCPWINTLSRQEERKTHEKNYNVRVRGTGGG